MSKESVLQLFEVANNDQAMQKELNAAADAAAVVALGARQGLTFTADELKEALAESAGSGEELSEDELQRVAGGVGQLPGTSNLKVVPKSSSPNIKWFTNVIKW